MASKLEFLLGKGEKCANHAMCKAGYCERGVCGLPEAGKPCSPDFPACPVHHYCHPENRHCLRENYVIPQKCSGDKDCLWGHYCDLDKKCKKRREIGANCLFLRQCVHEATCHKNQCLERCLDDFDCSEPDTKCRPSGVFSWEKLCIKEELPLRQPSFSRFIFKTRVKPPKPSPEPTKVVPPKKSTKPKKPDIPEPKKPEVTKVKTHANGPPVIQNNAHNHVKTQSLGEPSFFRRVRNDLKNFRLSSLEKFAKENAIALVIIGFLLTLFFIFVVLLARRAKRSRRAKKAAAAAAATVAASTTSPALPPSIYTTQPTSPSFGFGSPSLPNHHAQPVVPIAPPSYEEVVGFGAGGIVDIANSTTPTQVVGDEGKGTSSNLPPHEKS